MAADFRIPQRLRLLRRWIAGTLGVRFALAMGLSIAVWVGVTLDANPTAQAVVQGNIPVDSVDIPDGYLIVGALQPVQVAVEGPKTSLDLLSARGFVARVRLSGLGEGLHMIPVDVVTADPRVDVKRVTPSEIAVQLDRKVSISVPVRLVLIGQPAPGFRAPSDEVQFSPDKIDVVGPQTAARQVVAMQANVEISGLTSPTSAQVSARPVDSSGQEVGGVLPSTGLIDVAIPIERLTAQKTVPIKPQVVGVPAPGLVASRYSSIPRSVEIQGEPGIVETIEQLLAEPIEINGATEPVTAQVALIVPEGVTLVRGEATIEVRVEISAIRNSTVFVAGVLLRNPPKTMEVTLNPTSVQVLVVGNASALAKLSPTDIRAEIDLTGIAPGSFQLQPTILIPPGFEVTQVEPSTLGVTVRPVPTPTPSPTPTPTASPTGTPTEIPVPLPAPATKPQAASTSPAPTSTTAAPPTATPLPNQG